MRKTPVADSSLGTIDQEAPRYRFLEALPGLLSWGILILSLFVIRFVTPVFAVLMLLYLAYWVEHAIAIAILSSKGIKTMREVQAVDWQARLSAEYPDWRDYYYCTLIPFASESINVLKPTVESLAASDFPAERKILFLSPEAALPKGKDIAEKLKTEFEGRFAHIFITEHVLKPGELKGKASNQNHCGRFAYEKIKELGIDPGHVLMSSNDSDMHIDKTYPAYLLHTYLSEGEERDHHIYQPVPGDYEDFWGSNFFTRMLITTGVLWRLTLQVWANYRCTVYSFYSMSLKMLNEIGYWDSDIIPEDERTMFKAIASYGTKFKVKPLFSLVRGTSIRGDGITGSALEQYTQMRRWCWGASEFAHSVSVYRTLSKDKRKAMWKPIYNQIRAAVEWTLAPLFLIFGGFLPGIINPPFMLTRFGQIYSLLIAVLMGISTVLIIATIMLDRELSPERPANRRGFWARAFGYLQWFLSPAVSLAFSALPAFDAQTRLILNRRISYVESRKE